MKRGFACFGAVRPTRAKDGSLLASNCYEGNGVSFLLSLPKWLLPPNERTGTSLTILIPLFSVLSNRENILAYVEMRARLVFFRPRPPLQKMSHVGRLASLFFRVSLVASSPGRL